MSVSVFDMLCLHAYYEKEHVGECWYSSDSDTEMMTTLVNNHTYCPAPS
jgi:hypothetical protein